MSKNKIVSVWGKQSNKFLRGKEWKLLKSIVFDHFEKKCTNCGSVDNIHLDHIVARINDKGGSRWLDITNVQPLCEFCNCSIKGIKNTDYRTNIVKNKFEALIPLVEDTFNSLNMSTNWDIVSKKNEEKIISKTSKFKNKLKNFIKINTSFDATVKKFKIDKNTPNYKEILLFVKQTVDGVKSANVVKLKRMDKKQLELLNTKQQLEKNKQIKRNIKQRKRNSKRSIICNPR